MDATYSPIRRVSYQVDNARVEQRTNLDRLTVDIDTDGTLEAEEILESQQQFFNINYLLLLNWADLRKS